MIANLVADALADIPWYWYAIGFGGQAVFAARFIVQWLASERARKSVIPIAFWWLSISGGLMLLAWAFYQMDPVIITGQLTGTVVYTRNLILLRRAKAAAAENAA